MSDFVTQVVGITFVVSLLGNVYLFFKFKLADEKRKDYLNKWDQCDTKLTQSYVYNSKLMLKLSEFQSKRDRHKQEQSSWNKQRANYKKRIKELEG